MTRPRSLLPLLITLPLLHACGGSIGTEGELRLVNATSNYTSLDVVASGSTYLAGTGVGEASAYAKAEEGSYTFELRSSGSSSTAASVSTEVVAEAHQLLLAYVTGGSLQAIALGEEEAAPTSGTAKLRVLNAASGEVASVDVYLVGKACAELDETDVPAFEAVAGVDDTAFSEITAASAGTRYHLCVTTADEPTDVRLELADFSLANQQVLTLVLTRSRGGALLNALRIPQQGTITVLDNPSARVRLVADAASGAVVSASANGTALSSGAASPSVGSYRLVGAGELALTLSIGGTAVPASGLVAPAGADLTLMVAGTAASPSVRLLEDANLPSTSSTRPVKIRLVNGLNDTAASLLMTIDGDVVADGVAFGTASTPANVVASSGTATLEVSLAGSVLKSLSDLTLSSGRVYTYFVLGDASGTVSGVLRADR